MTIETESVNRGWLRRRIEAGLVYARCTHRFTDDYAYDAAVKFGQMDEYLPVRFYEEWKRTDAEPYRPEGFVWFSRSNFTGRQGSGHCYRSAGRIHFGAHSNESYELEVRAESWRTAPFSLAEGRAA